jgi:molecular chaperone GrpE (heat shock protein)
LLEQGQAVSAGDVMALARALARAWERLGLAPVGAPGELVRFDPALHQSLSQPEPAPGAEVEIRMPGYRHGTRLIRKALVGAGRPSFTGREAAGSLNHNH